jgi:type IV pilus assembly protein PilQ
MNRKNATRSEKQDTKAAAARKPQQGWARTAGLLFLAASAVYNGRAIAAGVAKAANPAAAASPAADSSGSSGLAVTPDNGGAAATAALTTPASDAKPAADAKPEAKVAEAKPADAKAPAAATQPSTQPSTGKSVLASEVAVSKDAGTVEIHVNDANIIEVLRMLSMQSNTNILPSKEVRGAVTVNLYDMTIKEALDAILKANGYGYREKGNVIYVYSAKEIADLEKSDHKLATEVFRLYYTPAVNAQTMVKPVLSSDGQVAVTTPAVTGIDDTNKDTGGNQHAVEDMMVVTDYPENLERVRKILKDVDRRPQQILVEATILRCALTEDNALGVDFTILGGVDFHSLSQNGSNPVDALSGAILNNTNPGAAKVVDTGFGGASTGFTGNVPAGGLRAGVITNNVAVFVSALEQVTNTVVMANPKVLVLNKQKGVVKVARQDPFRGKTTVSETGLTQQEVDFLETGTMLAFRPYVGDDGYIRMEVHPEDSTPLTATSSDLPPTKLTTEATTNIMVKDGHTVVIGGMFRETSQSTKSQIPVLGNIPLLGYLFRSQADHTQREEVIVLLTPHIIKDDSVYAKMSEKELKEAERLRVGVRRGMMPIGRERLAECCYDQAIHEWNKPHPDRKKVLWHLDCALNLNPTFSEAIDLKAKVTGREVTSADNSTIRVFVQQAVLKDVAVVKADAVPPAATPEAPAAAAAPAPAPAPAPATQPSSTPSSFASASAAPATQPSTQPSSKDATASGSSGSSFSSSSSSSSQDKSPSSSSSVWDPSKDFAKADEPTTKPTTQPSDAVAKSDSSSSKSDKPADPADSKDAKADASKDGSSSKDAAKDAKKDSGVTVTELPIEEIKDEPEKSDK